MLPGWKDVTWSIYTNALRWRSFKLGRSKGVGTVWERFSLSYIARRGFERPSRRHAVHFKDYRPSDRMFELYFWFFG